MPTRQIIVQPSQQSDPEICAWMDAVAERYPQYTSMFVKMALQYYIRTGEYMYLGSVPDLTDYKFHRSTYMTTVSIDEEIYLWKDNLKKNKIIIKRAILSILKSSICFDPSLEKPTTVSYGEVVKIPSKADYSSEFTVSAASQPHTIQKETFVVEKKSHTDTQDNSDTVDSDYNTLKKTSPSEKKESSSNAASIAGLTGRVFH